MGAATADRHHPSSAVRPTARTRLSTRVARALAAMVALALTGAAVPADTAASLPLGDTASLADTTTTGQRRTAERTLLAKINAARGEAGMHALAGHDGLSAAAREWSEEMRAEGRLSHDPDLEAHLGPGRRRIAENIAFRRSSEPIERLAAGIHDQLMGSPPHRANILGQWHHAGVGVAVAPDGTVWATVNFAEATVPPLPSGTRDIALGACHGDVPASGFTDLLGNVHADAIACLAFHGVASGTGQGSYDPDAAVTRGQTAAFLTRLIDEANGRALPDYDGTSRFADVREGHTHEAAVNRLAAAGIAKGGPAGRPAELFVPQVPVTRAQMAALLERTYTYVTGRRLASAGACFADAAGHPLRRAIDRLCVAGVVQGNSVGAYLPGASLRRDAMGSFLTRLLDVLAAEGAASSPGIDPTESVSLPRLEGIGAGEGNGRVGPGPREARR